MSGTSEAGVSSRGPKAATVATLTNTRPGRRAGAISDTGATLDQPRDQTRRRRRRWWLAAGSAAVALAVVSLAVPTMQRFIGAEASVPRARLRLAPVTRGDFVRDVAVDGTVVAAVSPTLFAVADGTVTFLVEAGDTVAAGQVVATLESPELESQLEQEQASLQGLAIDLERKAIEKKTRELKNRQTIDMAKVTITAAERELRRAEASRGHQVISEQDYEKARDDLEKARLEHQHAVQNAELESESMEFELKTMALERDRQRLVVAELERQVERLALRSPVDGMTGSLAVAQKTAVAKNAPLMSVVDLSAFEIEIAVPESYGDDLALGLEAEVMFGAKRYPATITAVSPEVRENEVTGRVRFAGQVPEGLRQNQRVSVRLVLESKPDTLIVRRGPFLDSGSGRVAYVVSDGVAARRSVRIGSTSISEVEILEGLEEGETIVISNLSQLDGARTVLLTE